MKISYLISLTIATVLLTGCGGEESGEAGTLVHNQGLNCAACHNGTVAEAIYLKSSGTIFTDLNATNYNMAKVANGYSLRLVLDTNVTEVYGLGRGTGNFYRTAINAGVATYTAQVLNAQGVVVNKSLTNSHNVARFNCNSCHVAGGLNGAPGRIVSFDYNASINQTTTGGTTAVAVPSFATDVLPILNAKCKSCHGTSGTFSITTSVTPYAGVASGVTTQGSSLINIQNAVNSPLLQKASGTITHGGGTILTTTSTQYQTVKNWISQGAKNN